jgi:hypothetical protein
MIEKSQLALLIKIMDARQAFISIKFDAPQK